MKTDEIMAALRWYNRSKGALFLAELRAGAGYGMDSQRRIDAWSIQTAPSKGNRRVAYEVKASRSDFTRERHKPFKQRPARLLSNQFYYVAPEGMIKPEDLPLWAGLLECKKAEPPMSIHKVEGLERAYLSQTVPAPFFETEPPNWRFVVSLIRHATKHAGTERMIEG